VVVDFEHLAPPQRLVPPRSFYLLWAESPQGKLIHLGQVVVGKNLDGRFKGSTVLKEFRLVLSAEDTPTPAAPSQPHVMTTEFFDSSAKEWYQLR
jgi:hypothetical protein